MGSEKLLGALGLARRAGKLALGQDAVCEAAGKGKAALVLITADTAQRTKKNVQTACAGRCPVHEIALTQQEIARITNKPAGTLAVTDKDLAALCLKQIGQTHKEERT